jgi:hypothetical protein
MLKKFELWLDRKIDAAIAKRVDLGVAQRSAMNELQITQLVRDELNKSVLKPALPPMNHLGGLSFRFLQAAHRIFCTPAMEALIYPGSPRWSGGRRPETMVA